MLRILMRKYALTSTAYKFMDIGIVRSISHVQIAIVPLECREIVTQQWQRWDPAQKRPRTSSQFCKQVGSISTVEEHSHKEKQKPNPQVKRALGIPADYQDYDNKT
ncbi:hypothetical protein G5I_04745 [Acromyrmex echinatior]|uniref:Uncharacterized protein n=1 Tax=Acromyrmex echinatior TaxID=103372 RepID=F4WGG9_ACREC|nr:hypothetical protein G5I_04745 [Acromyrmex echinatior]